MSCEIPNSYPSKLLPNIPDFYNGVTDGIDHLGTSTTEPLKILGAAGGILGGYDSYATFVNDIYRREPFSKYAIDLTSVAGAIVGGVAGVMVIGLLLPEIGIASLIVLGTQAAGIAIGSSIGGDLGSKLGTALFDPVPETKYIDELIKNRQDGINNNGGIDNDPEGTAHLRELADKAHAREEHLCPDDIHTPFSGAQHYVIPPRRDPLTFDLDGDGLETTAIAATNPILFDHDGDGVKNGTGWVKPDDGFLVLDKNGNGTIDNGRELFGDSTILTSGARAGQNAIDGFDALADLDSLANGGNADGKISNLDAQFTSLRIWRDLNQDGISQTGELFTLASLNIAAINVAKTANSQTLANGNQIADLGTFTKTDGTTGSTGAVTGNLADINLASDTFHRTFPNVLDTTSVATLPDMQGSGAVRDLREAATQSTTLQSLLTQFSAATTRAGQMALIDQLLDAWADTGGMTESMAQRIAANDKEWRVVA